MPTNDERLPGIHAERLPGIEPKTIREAQLFAERYLKPDLHGDFMRHLQTGQRLWPWLKGIDEELYLEVRTDGDCLRSETARLPYAERLDAIKAERERFEAWRAVTNMEELLHGVH